MAKTEQNEKRKILQKIAEDFNKKYDKECCRFGADSVERLKTGIYSLDKVTWGGLAKGRWNMVYGGARVGKTSLCNHIIANVQKAGGTVVVINSEHSWDPDYARKFGVVPEEVLVNSPSTLEEGETLVQKCVEYADLIVVDTIVAVAAADEAEKDMEKNTMGLIPRKLSEFFRKVTPKLGSSKCAVLLVNQVRMDPSAYIPVEQFSGGKALAHNCSLIIHLRRGAKADWPTIKVEGKDEIIGFQVVAKVEKTKVSPTEGQVAFYNLYKTPPVFRPEEEMINYAILEGVITQAGASYEYDTIKGRGRDAFVAALLENKEVMTKLKNEMK